ncbi:MAG: DUF3786 domain-containing protein [Terriglobia bacterium]
MDDKAWQAALNKAQKTSPVQAAKNCDIEYRGDTSQGSFELPVLGQPVRLSFPDFEATTEAGASITNVPLLTILLYHLATSNGMPVTGGWVTFSELPGGQYSQAMQKYTSDRIEGYFGSNFSELERAAAILSGEPLGLGGDFSARFNIFPRVPIALVFWRGDEEFPEARAKFLFDENARHHLPSDCYAILCSLITTGLIDKVGVVR